MLSQVRKKFLVQIKVIWQPLFRRRYLLLTNTLTAGGMLALGDILQQSWETHEDPNRARDWSRTGRMFVVGCSMGPLQHYWYSALDKTYAGTALQTVGKKVLVDQLITAPLIGIWYFLGMDVLEGLTLSEGWEESKYKFWESYKADWCVWPAAQMINFYFIAPKFRVLYINVVTLGWNTYLSYLQHRDDTQHVDLVSESSAVDVQQEASKQMEEKT